MTYFFDSLLGLHSSYVDHSKVLESQNDLIHIHDRSFHARITQILDQVPNDILDQVHYMANQLTDNYQSGHQLLEIHTFLNKIFFLNLSSEYIYK